MCECNWSRQRHVTCNKTQCPVHPPIIHQFAWPVTRRSALQAWQSTTAFRAASVESPVSASICWTHAWQGWPRRRFHFGMLSGQRPVRVSTARRSGVWIASGRQRMWLKAAGLLLWICADTLSRLVLLITAALVINWNQRTPRWQDMWKALIRYSSDLSMSHVSA